MQRRTFVLSVVLLPMLCYWPNQKTETEEYNCDIAESALGYWYVAEPTYFIVDWHYLDRAEFKIQRDVANFVKPGRVVGWFIATGPQRLLRAVWFSISPDAWFIEGVCITI